MPRAAAFGTATRRGRTFGAFHTWRRRGSHGGLHEQPTGGAAGKCGPLADFQ